MSRTAISPNSATALALADPDVLAGFYSFFSRAFDDDDDDITTTADPAHNNNKRGASNDHDPRRSKRLKATNAKAVPPSDPGDEDSESEDDESGHGEGLVEAPSFARPIDYTNHVINNSVDNAVRTVIPGPKSLRTGYVYPIGLRHSCYG
jgi:hypothetical protein